MEDHEYGDPSGKVGTKTLLRHIVYLSSSSLWVTGDSSPIFFGTSKTEPENLMNETPFDHDSFFGLVRLRLYDSRSSLAGSTCPVHLFLPLSVYPLSLPTPVLPLSLLNGRGSTNFEKSTFQSIHIILRVNL